MRKPFGQRTAWWTRGQAQFIIAVERHAGRPLASSATNRITVPTPSSTAHFSRAVAIAQAQKAKPWELRAATSMARLWRDRGERDKARVVKLLAPVDG
jgi:hypothetical protein